MGMYPQHLRSTRRCNPHTQTHHRAHVPGRDLQSPLTIHIRGNKGMTQGRKTLTMTRTAVRRFMDRGSGNPPLRLGDTGRGGLDGLDSIDDLD